jgi:hypothetical protein
MPVKGLVTADRGLVVVRVRASGDLAVGLRRTGNGAWLVCGCGDAHHLEDGDEKDEHGERL